MTYQTIDGKVINENGDVAIAYYQTIPQRLQVNGRMYRFDVSHNICMAWVKPEDVQIVLSVIKTCCNNQRKTVYRLEHEAHVRRWLGEAER